MRLMIRKRCLLVALSLWAPSGCTIHEPCEVRPETVRGSPTDYTLTAAEYDGYLIEPVAECGSEGHRIAVTGLGARTFGLGQGAGCTTMPVLTDECPVVQLDAFLGDVDDSLEAGGVTGRGSGLAGCDEVPSPYVHIDDWALADATVRIVGARLDGWGLGETVEVIVRPIDVACPASN